MKTNESTALVLRQTGALAIIGTQLRLKKRILDAHQLAKQTTIIDPTTGMVLQKVIGGTFTMGDTFGDGYVNELPTHQVTVGDFYIGRYPVTQGEWQAVMGSNPSYFTDGGASCPVEQVSWNDVQIFIRKLNYLSGNNFRLPTEAEWEYAARSGGKKEKYSGGNDINAVAWYWENSGGTTRPVGQKRANGLGLYDMSGNVLEWVSDWYDSYSSDSQTNPAGPLSGSGRVLRSGSWGYVASGERASIRSDCAPDDCGCSIGFRLASPVQCAQPSNGGPEQATQRCIGAES